MQGTQALILKKIAQGGLSSEGNTHYKALQTAIDNNGGENISVGLFKEGVDRIIGTNSGNFDGKTTVAGFAGESATDKLPEGSKTATKGKDYVDQQFSGDFMDKAKEKNANVNTDVIQ